mmetsp:Transcript_26201/g.56765  ORF Transcript_26201/g.56765 Transcript_26201/m.56765 type:complete len:339 (-) Transcript_26201:110-1126(-)
MVHGLPLRQVEAARAACLLATPLLFLTTFLLVIGPIASLSLGWFFHLSGGAASGIGGCLPIPSPLDAAYSCTAIHYALGLVSSSCFDATATAAAAAEQHPGETCSSSSLMSSSSWPLSSMLHFFFSSHSAPATSAAAFAQTTAQHHDHHTLTGLIPWFVSLLLGVVCPCVLFLLAQYQIWRGELRLEDDFLGDFPWGAVREGGEGRGRPGFAQTKKQRKDILMKRLRDYTRTVEDKDIVSTAANGACDDVQSPHHDHRTCRECSQSSLLVPKPGRPNNDDGINREIQNLCAICFGDYKCGQEIVWSSNCDCRHVFHKSCALPWLVRNHRCPMCRQTFA